LKHPAVNLSGLDGAASWIRFRAINEDTLDEILPAEFFVEGLTCEDQKNNIWKVTYRHGQEIAGGFNSSRETCQGED